MRKIYIDTEYKCHIVNDGTMTPVEVDHFDGKCDSFVEGHCCIVDENSIKIYPWKPYHELDEAQMQYELDQISAYSSVLSEIEATIKPVGVRGMMKDIVGLRKQSILSRINDMLTALYTLEVTPVDE